MYRLQRRSAPLILCLFAAFAMVLQFPVATIAATNVTTEISHKPVDSFVPGQRLRVLAEIEDEAGVNLVRCYFKTPEEADFVFVPMSLDENGQYAGILPAPDTTTESIEYLFLVVNGNNAVVKSQVFTAEKDSDSKAVAGPAYENSIQVYSEVSAEAAPAGFADSIAMDLVESGARFGIVAGGLYLADAATAAGTTGAAASASAAGTVAAAAGISTTTLVLGGLAAAAIVGGAAAAGGGGSSSDGDNESEQQDPTDITQETTKSDLAGNWYFTEQDSSWWSMTATLNEDGTGTADDGTGSFNITWHISGNPPHFNMQTTDGGNMGGTISGTIYDFWVNGHWANGNSAYFHAVKK